MNIGLDSNALITSANRGIGNYAIGLYSNLIKYDRKNRYFLLNWKQDTLLNLIQGADGRVEECLMGQWTEWNRMIYRENPEKMERVVRDFIREKKIDVFITASTFDLNFAPYSKRWFGKTLLIGTVHDLIPLVFQKQYLADEERYQYYMRFADALNQYDFLVTDSKSTRRDVIEYLGMNSGKISNIYLDISSNSGFEFTDHEAELLKNSFHITMDYILTVAGTGYNKNVTALIRAFGDALKRSERPHQLVIACKLVPNVKASWSRLIEHSGLMGRVILTDYVSDRDLEGLYQTASWMAFPSLYEGFGLPVLEAWRHGLPVLTSDNSSLGEISRGAAVQVDPNDIKSIGRGLTEIMNMSPEERNDYKIKGMERAGCFSWEKTAIRMLRLVEHVQQRAIRNRIKECYWNSGAYKTYRRWIHHKEFGGIRGV